MSRLLASSTALTQFTVTGTLPGPDDLFSIISSALSRFAFRPINDTPDAVSTGWVQIDDMTVAAFDNPGSVWIGHFLFFSLRQDVRRIPGAVLKQEMKKEEDTWLKEHPNMRRMPKRKREETKEATTLKLLAKTLPVPSVSDVVWDTKTGTIYLFANAGKMIDLFESLFRKTFPEYGLKMVIPYHRAEQSAISTNLTQELIAANQAGSDSLLSLIKDNTWIGRDFFLWLLAGSSGGQTNGFSAWIDKRLVMIGMGGEGLQKITVAGDVAGRFPTIKTTIQDGKQITSATVYIEDNDGVVYRMTLAGDTFIMNGFRTPAVRLDGEIDDTINEFQAAILEKMHLVNTGLGYLHTLLTLFLEERLTTRWGARLDEIQTWMEE
jgi:hypothetical protein